MSEDLPPLQADMPMTDAEKKAQAFADKCCDYFFDVLLPILIDRYETRGDSYLTYTPEYLDEEVRGCARRARDAEEKLSDDGLLDLASVAAKLAAERDDKVADGANYGILWGMRLNAKGADCGEDCEIGE